ncbi:MAG: hypothetical protein HQK51_19025 [Oligoflexia bacterium]|nr:hypothetical protein [Oligoflexia bacterium]
MMKKQLKEVFFSIIFSALASTAVTAVLWFKNYASYSGRPYFHSLMDAGIFWLVLTVICSAGLYWFTNKKSNTNK